VAEIGGDLRQRFEDKPPFRDSRVRNLELWCFDYEFAVKEQVDVNRTRSFRNNSLSAHLALNPLDTV
jgi:hypothetical protein